MKKSKELLSNIKMTIGEALDFLKISESLEIEKETIEEDILTEETINDWLQHD